MGDFTRQAYGRPRANDAREELLAYLRENPGRTTQEIAQALGKPTHAVKHLLYDLRRCGLVSGQRLTGTRARPTVWEAPDA